MKASIFIVLAGLSLSVAAQAVRSKDEEQVRGLIQNMYSYSIANFELAYFDGRLNLKKHCELLKQYFQETLIRQPTISSGCGINEFGSIRYPALNAARTADPFDAKRVPKVIFSEPRVAEAKATMGVTAGSGRSIYYLEKVANEWRIANVLLYETWPSADGICLGSYLSPPTAEHKKLEPRQCKD